MSVCIARVLVDVVVVIVVRVARLGGARGEEIVRNLVLHMFGVVHGVRRAVVIQMISRVISVCRQLGASASSDSFARFFVIFCLVHVLLVVNHERVLMNFWRLERV